MPSPIDEPRLQEILQHAVKPSSAEIRDIADRWRALGASHLTIDPRAVSLHVDKDISMAEKVERRKASLGGLIDNLRRAADALGPSDDWTPMDLLRAYCAVRGSLCATVGEQP